MIDESSALAPLASGVVSGEYDGPEGRRPWRLFVPAGDATTPRAMLVMLHGCTQDAADIARGTRFDEEAQAGNFLVLYPEQTVAGNPRRCWNWFDAAHQSRGSGEPAILAAMIAKVGAEYHADPHRVHLAGVSAGAGMSVLLAVAYPERFASLTSASGIGWRAASDVAGAIAVMQKGAGDGLPSGAAMRAAMGANAWALPVLVVHGGKDAVVSVRNADETARQFAALHDLVRGEAGQAPLVGAEMPPRVEHGYTVQERHWNDAGGRVAVTLVRVDELGHAWSGGSPSGTFTDSAGPKASQLIATFIAQHARPAVR
ncbi:PHB depolymerase family esterase [Gemmatimonas sp.]|uniref:extracellular catalytic domain type 1 short-chain-length polyhydroxyalkanoate depolymerase n=1 Tax=Gemmatimonas sp. TaxID=1962908 RepID=UPI00286EB3DC|nr:PHB depolymerase family esterase [Gemmatimonas sp.]